MPTPTFNDLDSPMHNGDDASQVKSKAAELGRQTADAVDERRDTLARGMESAASTLRGRADRMPGGERMAKAAHATAGAMENAAGYVRDNDVKDMLSDMGQLVKKHPGKTLLTVAAVGFLLARSFSSRN